MSSQTGCSPVRHSSTPSTVCLTRPPSPAWRPRKGGSYSAVGCRACRSALTPAVDNARSCCYRLRWPGPWRGGPRSARGEVMIRFDNVTKVYGNDTVALERVNLGIDSGEFVFLVGASGSGKSTIVRLILKEIEPSAGAIYVNGTRLSSVPRRRIPRVRRGIGCVFQDFKLLPNKTAAENVAYAMEVTGQRRRTIRTKVPQILDLVGLSGKMDKFPEMLSGGEQQRVSIARAFVSQPPILVADEPTGNLDPTTSVGIMQLLHRINRIGTTVLVATHDREMVDVMRKRVVALEAGRVVRDKVKGAYADVVYPGVLSVRDPQEPPPESAHEHHRRHHHIHLHPGLRPRTARQRPHPEHNRLRARGRQRRGIHAERHKPGGRRPRERSLNLARGRHRNPGLRRAGVRRVQG